VSKHNCKRKVTVKLEQGLEPLQICVESATLTCGWLLKEVIKRYTHIVDQMNKDARYLNQGRNFKKKIIAAVKSCDNNESVDYWLTLYK